MITLMATRWLVSSVDGFLMPGKHALDVSIGTIVVALVTLLIVTRCSLLMG